MRIIRLLLVFTAFFAFALPTFACITCEADCVAGHPGDPRCKPTIDGCTTNGFCAGGLVASIASEWTVASVEVTRPAVPGRTVTAQSVRLAAVSARVKSVR